MFDEVNRAEGAKGAFGVIVTGWLLGEVVIEGFFEGGHLCSEHIVSEGSDEIPRRERNSAKHLERIV